MSGKLFHYKASRTLKLLLLRLYSDLMFVPFDSLPGSTNKRCYRNTYPSFSGTNFYQFGCGSTDEATFVATSASGIVGQFIKVVKTAISLDGDSIMSQTQAPDPIPTTASDDTSPTSTEITSTIVTSTSVFVKTAVKTSTSTSTSWTEAKASTAASSSYSPSAQPSQTPSMSGESTVISKTWNTSDKIIFLGLIPLFFCILIIIYFILRRFKRKVSSKATSNFEVLSDPIVPTSYEMEATPAASSRNAIYEMCAVVSNARYQQRHTISELEDSSSAHHKRKRKSSNELRIAVLHGQHDVGSSSSPAELASERSPRLRSIYELPP